MRDTIKLVNPACGERNNWYAASHEYTEVAVRSLIPKICEHAPTNDHIVGLSASFGAIALLKCAYQYPGTFGGMLLQSTSFFHPELDHEYDLSNVGPEYWQIAKFVQQVRTSGKTDSPMNIRITCGDEPLARSFDDMKWHLAEQGHNISGARIDGEHSFEDWGKGFYPHLGEVMQETWGDEWRQAA